MRESGGTDSIFGGGSMPKPCSLELRERVVEAIASGASRREAAEWFAVSPSSAIKWMQRQQETGSIAPKPSGGSISPLEAHAADRRQPQRGVALLRAALYQLQKKACRRRSKSERTWPAHGGAGCENRACLTQPDWCSSPGPRPTPPWCGFEA